MSTLDSINASKNPATSSLANAKTGSGAAAAQTRLSQNLDDFLKLLTTQLTNQDPTQPLDANQFTAQIAQLSQVEQGINTNKNLESLITKFNNSQINGVVGYIGKRVDAEGNIGTLQNGVATFSYSLAGPADKATVTISDSTGRVVFSGDGDTLSGRNEVYWNGKNSSTGAQMADGNYTIAVKAVDKNGAEVKATTYTTGIVNAVDLVNGEPSLSLGSTSISLNKVLNIREDTLTQIAKNTPQSQGGTEQN